MESKTKGHTKTIKGSASAGSTQSVITVRSDPNGSVTFTGDVESLRELLGSLCGKQTDVPSGAEHGMRQTVPPAEETRTSKLASLATRIRHAASAMFHQRPQPTDDESRNGHSSQQMNKVDQSTVNTNRPIRQPLISSRPERRPEYSPQLADETNYLEILGLYDKPLWPSFKEFQCPRCRNHIAPLQGIVLKNCQIHAFCRDCLVKRILDSPFREVLCPSVDECDAPMNEEEIFALLDGREADKQAYTLKSKRSDAENDVSLLENFIEQEELRPNVARFECPICVTELPPLKGVVPKNCGKHAFCRDCLRGAITMSDIPLVKCPAAECLANLQDREVQLLTSDKEYQALHQRGVEKALTQRMVCQTVNCKGLWYASVQGSTHSRCPECGVENYID